MVDTTIPGSFIPHDAADTGGSGYRGQSGLPDLALLISIVLFVASAALAGGVFLYSQYLDTANASKVQQLERAKAAFEPSLIAQLMRLNDRMSSADVILGNHLAPSMFFDALQAATLATVSFSNLDLQAADTHSLTIKMSGVAKSVNSIALQADLLSKNGVIKDPIFSGIDRELDGVHFNLNAEVDPKAITFARHLNSSAQAAGAAAATQQAPTERTPFGLPVNGADSTK
jgi:hypothetical protein